MRPPERPADQTNDCARRWRLPSRGRAESMSDWRQRITVAKPCTYGALSLLLVTMNLLLPAGSAAIEEQRSEERARFGNATKIMKPEHLRVSDDKSTPPGRIVLRHTDGANVAFCDGHVKWLRPEAIRPGMFNPDWSP